MTGDALQELQHTEVSPPPTVRSPLLKRQMPGLDALRGLAVLAVVAFHGLSGSLPPHGRLTPAARLAERLFAPGWLGVNLFFVLSGFLITGILLDTRQRHDYWRNFYLRRILRIYPLFLLVLVLLALRGYRLSYLLLCLLNGANLVGYMPRAWVPHSYGPLWSLAVEEQFYLVWPLLVLRLSRRMLGWVCVALVLLSPLLRALALLRWHWLGDPNLMTWLLADNLAWGALLAVLLRTRHLPVDRLQQRLRHAFWMLPLAAFALVAAMAVLHRQGCAPAWVEALQTAPFLCGSVTMLLLALRYGDIPAAMRLTAPLRFFGYLSYGLYLLHMLAFYLYDDVFGRHTEAAAQSILTLPAVLLRFATAFTAATLLAYLSRRYFEEFFLNWKGRLAPYSRWPRAAAEPSKPV